MAPLITDPCDWELDDDGDLVMPLRYTTGPKAVEQSQQINLRAVRGEWFADLDDGVRWFENDVVPERLAILGGKFEEPRILQEFRSALLASFGVSEVLSLKVAFDRRTRKVSGEYSTKTVWGDTTSDTLEQ